MIKRAFRRATVRGDATIYDHELAALQVLCQALSESDRQRFVSQIARYDRIDRASNFRKQMFIDDDSDFSRSNWPRDILFHDAGGTEHSANITIRRSGAPRVKVQAFVVRGWFSGFEFTFPAKDALSLVEFPISDVLARFTEVPLNWVGEEVVLFTPFSERKSDYVFVPA
jgi:hypothetical protein